MDSIKKNLTNIVVIIGLIGSIGAGFTKFAKMESTIEQLAAQTAPDLTGIETNGFAITDNTTAIAVIEEKVSATLPSFPIIILWKFHFGIALFP